MYFLDRTSVLRWGRPITTDRYVSMDNGPVVSRIYELIREEPEPGVSSVWHQHISPPENFEVSLLKEAPLEELSRAEEALIEEIDRDLGAKNKWELVRLSHELPEWRDPEGTSIPIEYRDIFQAADMTETEILALTGELESLALVQRL